MLSIQLAPKLQNVVHMLKNLESNQSPVPLFAGGLSKEESSAINSTFSTREKKQTEPICNWW